METFFVKSVFGADTDLVVTLKNGDQILGRPAQHFNQTDQDAILIMNTQAFGIVVIASDFVATVRSKLR